MAEPQRQGAPTPRLLLPQEKVGLGAPRVTRPSVAVRPANVPKLKPPKPAGGQKDDGFSIGDIGRSIGSGLGYVGNVLKNLPTIGGKLAQTGLGLAEFAVDTVLDVPTVFGAPEFYRSRYEQDWAKAEEMGLQGWEKWKYAADRQYPIFAPIAEGYKDTGSSLGELATFGVVDLGEPGFDYYQALKRGDLGAKLLNDLGNVMVVGRMAGAGSVTARAGSKLAAAGKPRLGAAVSRAGRLADEPIGETARITASTLGRGARLGGLTKTAEALGRVSAAIPVEGPTIGEAFKTGLRGEQLSTAVSGGPGPLRQAVNEIAGARGIAAVKKFDTLQSQINNKTDELDQLSATDPRRTQIDEDLALLRAQQKAVLDNTNLPKQVRRAVVAMQNEGESLRTVLQTEVARIKRSGFVQEPVEVLRKRAEQLRADATKAADSGDTAQAERLNNLADFTDRQASVKETNPGVLDTPPPAWVSPVTMLLLTKRGQFIQQMLSQGYSYQDIADILTPIGVGPDLELKGYRFTADDVKNADDFLSGRMNDVDMLMVDMNSILFTSWYRLFNDARNRGIGGTGPQPYTSTQTTPDPKFLAIELGKYSAPVRKDVLKRLDEAVGAVLLAFAPEIAKELDITPKNLKNAFRKAASQDYDSVAFRITNVLVAQMYDDMLALFPDVFRDKMIFPAPMRPLIEAQQGQLKLAQAEEIDLLLSNMARFAITYPQFVAQKTIDSIIRKYTKLKDGPARFDRNEWSGLRRQVRDLYDRISQQRKETEDAVVAATGDVEASRLAVEQLKALEDQFATLEGWLATVTQNPELYIGLNPKLQEAADLKQAKDVDARRADILQSLLDSELAQTELAAILQRLGNVDERIDNLKKQGLDEQASALRRIVKGTDVGVSRVNLPGGLKGPPVLRPLQRAVREFESEQNKLVEEIGQLEDRNTKLEQLRAKNRQLDQAENEMAVIEGEAMSPVVRTLQAPFGPQLLGPGEAPIYLPGGLTAQARGGTNLPTELRSEGMAGQFKPSFERTRETTIAPLSLTEVGQRMAEVLSSMTRNDIVERIITDPEFATNPVRLLTEETIQQLEEQARQQVMAQQRGGAGTTGLPRNPREIDAEVAKQLGVLIAREIDRRGYEPVSPIRVNDDGTHQAMGDLLSRVDDNQIDRNTYLMRKGLKQRITQQFVYKESGAVPARIRTMAQNVGRYTSGWKSYILPFSLRWQIGDAASNIMFAWSRGDINPRILGSQMRDVAARLKAQEGKFLESVEGSIADPLFNTLIGAGLQSRGLRLADLAALRRGIPGAQINEFGLTGPFKGFRNKMFRLNELQNTISRLSVAIINLTDILEAQGRSIDEINPSTYLSDPALRDAVNEAVSKTNDTLGAFSQLSPFEKNYVRQLYPFWSWLKFSNQAAAQLAIDNPDRVLFMAHLGSMVADDEDQGLLGFLRGTVPIQGYLFDLSFLNPYQDAILFSPNPIKEALDTAGRLSPVITAPFKAVGTLGYYATGSEPLPFSQMQRPSYLEGRFGENTRSLGTLIGELGYLGLKEFGGPARNVLRAIPTTEIPFIAPQGRLLGTDVAIGNVSVYPQGSKRTTGALAQPRLGPVAGPLSAILGSLAIPAPLAKASEAQEQSRVQRQRAAALRQRREKEFKESRND